MPSRKRSKTKSNSNRVDNDSDLESLEENSVLEENNIVASSDFCCGIDDVRCLGRAWKYNGVNGNQCRNCEYADLGIGGKGLANVGRLVSVSDDPVSVGGLYVVNGSTAFAEYITSETNSVFGLHYPFPLEGLRSAVDDFLEQKIFVSFTKGSSTNRGSDHYSTGLLSARTMGILRQNTVFRDFLDAVAPPGIAEITSLWLTCSDALSEENPDGGYHDIHGDGRYWPADFRFAMNLNDSDDGKAMHFQSVDDGRWVQFACPAGTIMVLNEHGGGVGRSPIVHGIQKGSKVYALLGHVKLINYHESESDIDSDDEDNYRRV